MFSKHSSDSATAVIASPVEEAPKGRSVREATTRVREDTREHRSLVNTAARNIVSRRHATLRGRMARRPGSIRTSVAGTAAGCACEPDGTSRGRTCVSDQSPAGQFDFQLPQEPWCARALRAAHLDLMTVPNVSRKQRLLHRDESCGRSGGNDGEESGGVVSRRATERRRREDIVES